MTERPLNVQVAEAIVESNAIPCGLSAEGGVTALPEETAKTYSSFDGAAPELVNDVNCGENLLASGGVQCMLNLWELTREAVFDALHDRRCYATTGEPIVLGFSCEGNVMGSELPAGSPAAFECFARGTSRIEKMMVIKNGQAVVSFPVDMVEEERTWVDPDPGEGPAYYYLKVMQRDGELAWSSPIWIG